MTFYVYINNLWQQVNVEIESRLAKALDTTNDTFSCVLEANDVALPYAPMTQFKIVDDSDKTTIMWVINDTVEVFSTYPLLYKHTLSLVQYRYFLNKHLLRNTVFSQPRLKNRELYTSMSVGCFMIPANNYNIYSGYIKGDGSTQVWYDDIALNQHTKIKNGRIKFDLYSCINQQLTITKNQLTDSVLNDCSASLRRGTYIRLVDVNNNNHSLYTWYIFEDYQNGDMPIGEFVDIPNSAITTINNYIATRQNNSQVVLLRAVYGVEPFSGDSQLGESYDSFLNTTRNNIDIDDSSETFLNFANLQVRVDFELFNYTMYDVLEVSLEQYKLATGNNVKRSALFNLPTSGELYDLLTTTYPPDTLSFTQATFYDVLTEIFRFYDAGFKFDENKTLDIEYYNNPNNEVNPQLAGRQIYHNDKNYNNGRVSYYQNSLQLLKVPQIKTRADGVGIPTSTDYAIITPKPIYTIEKLSMYLSGSFTIMTTQNVVLNNFELDITPYVVSEDIWGVLDKSVVNFNTTFYNYTTLYQEGTLKFARNSNTICVSSLWKTGEGTQKYCLQKVIQTAWRRFFGIAEQSDFSYTPTFSNFSSPAQNYRNQTFNIEYTSLVNGRLEVETLDNKYVGEMIVNQGQGRIDIAKLGLNILGESLKDGEPTLTVTCEITDWSNRIVEGDYITYNGSRWVANVVNYNVISNGVYQCTIEFVKNFNALALRVQTDNDKRLTAISNNMAILSEDNYIDYVYVSDSTTCYTRTSIALDYKTLESIIGQTLGISDSGYDNKNIDYAFIGTKNFGNSEYVANGVYIPLVKYGSGNSICFEVQFDNPISAGNQLLYGNGWWGSNNYFSQVIKYTDDEGWADVITLWFRQKSDVSFSNFNYPLLSNNSIGDVGSLTIKYYLKPNEIFGLNYQVCFLPKISEINDFFIGQSFITNNAFISENSQQNKKFYLYYSTSDDFSYNILDTKGHQQSGNPVGVIVGTRSKTNSVQLYILTTSTINAKTWSICDSNGNIYFASNHAKTFTSSYSTTSSIYFNTRKLRATSSTSEISVGGYTTSGTFNVGVSSNEWQLNSAVSNINITDSYNSIQDYFIDNVDLVHRYTVELSNVWETRTMASGYPKCISNESGTYTNTATFNQSTHSISGVVYYQNYPNTHPPISFIIQTKVDGATDHYTFYKQITIAEVQGVSLSNVAISPATITIDGITYTNVVRYDANSGVFTITVYSANATDTTYTITYS